MKTMTACIYLDQLLHCGFISEGDWDVVSMRFDNSIEIDVPEDVLRSYYSEMLQGNYEGMPFWKWYSEESICDDFDGLIGYRGWYPFLADVHGWTEMLRSVKKMRG